MATCSDIVDIIQLSQRVKGMGKLHEKYISLLTVLQVFIWKLKDKTPQVKGWKIKRRG